MSLIDTAPTALYRFFDKAGVLLYIGITNSIPRRLDQHHESKPWHTQATRITVEHHPSRRAALEAEKAAIQAEKPKYNIQHNRRRAESVSRKGKKPGRWVFESRRSGHERSVDLHLYGELDCSSMVDDVYDLDGEGQLEEYVQYLKRHHPEWLREDAVPILWCVVGQGTFENAPFQTGRFALDTVGGPHEDFLSYFSWPYDRETYEELDFFKLPVRNERFPEFAEALDWTPSPMQPTCPLRSILDSRNGRVRRPEGWRPPW